MPENKNLRMRKLVRPRLQLRLTLSFVGLAFMALAFQFVLFTSVMSQTLDGDTGAFSERFVDVAGAYQRVFLISLGVVLPLTALVGILTTFRIVGPLFNISRFLQRTLDGQNPEDCRLRSGDEYQDLADLANRVTAPLRRAASAGSLAGASTSNGVDTPVAALPAENRSQVS
jgi:methyl-accepting chemotaxis protein